MRRQIRRAGQGRVASIVGRYYAMDRTRQPLGSRGKAYDLMTTAGANFRADTAVAGLRAALVMKTMSLVKRPLSAPRAG
ncbi:hypothetical protein KCP76_08890 [Salmonella enterica subsp. enterica serovar Weltevreden]|nr:hypothetical protein KCP76_08890 [Salmonella enterica subsp. enterica serovar Weltevreden]